MLDRLLSFIAPHPCLGCGILGTALCGSCKEDIVKQGLRGHPDLSGDLDGLWVVGTRSGLLQKAVGAYKFTPMRALADTLALLLTDVVPPEPYTLVPIPTIGRHVRSRGFDHIGLLTKELSRQTGSTIEALIGRQGQTQQKQATRAQRQTQADKSFQLNGVPHPSRRYLLVDDVITTGATVRAAARLLRAGGAQYVACVAPAYQPLD